MDSILVFSSQTGPRLSYILGELSRRIGISFLITSSDVELNGHEGPKIIYGQGSNFSALHIPCNGLLSESGPRPLNPEVYADDRWNKIFFKADGDYDVPFDLFSAAFFLLSRYEEYLPHAADKHGRYSHDQSLAFRHGFLEIPIADTWCEFFKKLIRQKFPTLSFKENRFDFISTIDIDFAYMYRGIGPTRALGKFINAFSHFRLVDLARQFQVHFAGRKDPYDTYERIENTVRISGREHIYFLLVKTGTPYDKNIPPDHPLMKNLVMNLNQRAITGLHPSYFSEEQNTIGTEKAILEKLGEKEITSTRQHFLKFTLPETYRALLKAGFTDDYSMAYAGASGFRASTCFPFFFYDLGMEKTSSLLVHPAPVMDVTLKNYEGLSPQEAVEKIRNLIAAVKNVNGTFISIWHNSSLCEDAEWKGWRVVFDELHHAPTLT